METYDFWLNNPCRLGQGLTQKQEHKSSLDFMDYVHVYGAVVRKLESQGTLILNEGVFSESSQLGGVEVEAEICGRWRMSVISRNLRDDLPNQEKNQFKLFIDNTMGLYILLVNKE